MVILKLIVDGFVKKLIHVNKRLSSVIYGMGFFLLFFAAELSAGDVVTVAVGKTLQPYIDAKTGSGIELQIIKEAFKVKGRKVRFLYFFGEGGVKNFSLGRVDSLLTNEGDSLRRKIGRNVYYTNGIVNYKNFAISLKSRGLEIESIEGLSGLKVASFSSANKKLGSDFERQTKFMSLYKELPNQLDHVIALYDQYVDVVVADKYVFEYHRRSWHQNGGADKEVSYHPLFEPSARRLVFFDESLVQDFNEGLAALKNSGRHQEIIRSYGL